jgi:hypothetical protein
MGPDKGRHTDEKKEPLTEASRTQRRLVPGLRPRPLSATCSYAIVGDMWDLAHMLVTV